MSKPIRLAILGSGNGTNAQQISEYFAGRDDVQVVSIIYNVKQEDIYGKSRKSEIVLARQLSIYLAQVHTQLSASKIGLLIGNKNHATVLHSIKTIKKRLKIDKNLKEQVDELTSILKGTR